MRAVVRLMWAATAVSTASLIIPLALIAEIKAGHAILGQPRTAAQVSQVTTPAITQAIVPCLVTVGSSPRPAISLTGC